jgi:formimidoylglutamate deiminase
VDDQGRILEYSKNLSGPKFENVGGYALPGFKNAHSHSFQYLLSGLTENLQKGKGKDDFWSWRNVMYKLANKINPPQLEALAAMVYSQMLKMGFTSVAEFHYLHHDTNGNPYPAIAEMSERLLMAAYKVGMNITLLPAFYQRSDFGKPPLREQRRFISPNPDRYFRLFESVEKMVEDQPYFSMGVCVHSLRAAETESLLQIFRETSQSLPAHIHVAEQVKEVKTCLAFLRKTPVKWLLENLELCERYHLVHATHMTSKEAAKLAKSKANVVLCPTTEANLGDGIFNLLEYREKNGSFSIGTDGHFNLNPLEELRFLDYVQRLKTKRRNVLCQEEGDRSADILYLNTLKSGEQAMGKNHALALEPGTFLDVVILDPNHPVLSGLTPSNILSGLIYGGDPSIFLGTITHGHWVVKKGIHEKHQPLFKDYSRAKLEILKLIV